MLPSAAAGAGGATAGTNVKHHNSMIWRGGALAAALSVILMRCVEPPTDRRAPRYAELTELPATPTAPTTRPAHSDTGNISGWRTHCL